MFFFSTGNGAQNVWSLFGTGIHRQIPIGRFRFLGDRPTVAEIVFASLRTETAAATTESHRSRLVFFHLMNRFFLDAQRFFGLLIAGGSTGEIGGGFSILSQGSIYEQRLTQLMARVSMAVERNESRQEREDLRESIALEWKQLALVCDRLFRNAHSFV